MLEPAARRLVVASAVRLHVARSLGPAPLGPGAEDLAAASARLGPVDDRFRRVHGLTFTPDYPGSGAVEEVRGGVRLVLTCRAAHLGEDAALVVTTLIGGRVPQVTAAP